ncbi:MAG: cytochrome c oxidase accessory protein CcoG [Bdellovibrionota bacterium]
MAESPFELHSERLGTTDASGGRVFLFTADVKGKFRRARTLVHFIFVTIFLVMPWIKINHRQALLLDVIDRRFEIFGLSLRAHNAPLIFFVFAAAGFGLFFVTAVWGRVWCGWACPQTVFIDFIFRRIERLVEGPALKRRALASADISFAKTCRKTLKWTLYTLASLVISHSFFAYFVGTENLKEMIFRSPTDNWASFLFILFSTGILLFNFSWFREQFCIIACPYGRFQSVIMDNHSLVVTYDVARGEPRATPQAKALAKSHNSNLGDCVNCYRCVQVCPVGIDIRRGTQMECINCTACIDACDDVMTHTNKPHGLIRYESAAGLQKRKRVVWRPRSILYFSLTVAAILGLSISMSQMTAIDVQLLRPHDAPYTVESNAPGASIILNHFNVALRNQGDQLHQISFKIPDDLIEKYPDLILTTAYQPISLAKDGSFRTQVLIRFPREMLSLGKRKIRVQIIDQEEGSDIQTTHEKEVTLVGPIT